MTRPRVLVFGLLLLGLVATVLFMNRARGEQMTEAEAIGQLTAAISDDDVRFRPDADGCYIAIDKRGDEACQYVPAIRSLHALIDSGTSNDELTDRGLAFLKGHPNLAEVSLHSNNIGEAGFAVLPTLSKLSILDIIIKKNVDYGCKHIGRCQGLKKLSFNGSEISDAGLKELGSLFNLQQLDLYGCPVSQQAQICSKLELLEKLSLDSTLVDDAALLPLCSHPRLQTLSLCSTKITDVSGKKLAGISNLEKLYLDDTAIGDETVIALSAAPKIAVHPTNAC